MKKNILILTINFPPNPSVGTRRIAKILKYVNHDVFAFHVLTLKEEYYNAELGKKSGDYEKIPQSVKVYRTDRFDITWIFTKTKSLVKRALGLRNSGSVGRRAQAENGFSGAVPASNSIKSKKLSSFVSNIRDFIFSIFEFPDKYIGWLPGALKEGIRIIRREKIEAIFTTAPPHSLFVIAVLLKKITGVRLILDYRDPWTLSRWDIGNSIRNKIESRIETRAVKRANLIVMVTENLQEAYRKRFSLEDPDKFKLFSNGFDPDDFPSTKKPATHSERRHGHPYRFVHLGTLYKKRDPEPLFIALRNLIRSGRIKSTDIIVEFIGTVANELSGLYDKIKEYDLQDSVKFLPPVSFNRSIQTMYTADGLLLIQPGTDLQVPAKLFEYMYTGTPVLAIAEEGSATDRVLKKGRLGLLAPSGNIELIEQQILEMMNNENRTPDSDYLKSFNFKYCIGKFENYLLQACSNEK